MIGRDEELERLLAGDGLHEDVWVMTSKVRLEGAATMLLVALGIATALRDTRYYDHDIETVAEVRRHRLGHRLRLGHPRLRHGQNDFRLGLRRRPHLTDSDLRARG